MSRSEGKSLKVQHVPRDDGTVEVFIPERGEKYRYNMPKARPREPLANYKLADVHEMYQRCYQEFDSSDFCTDLHKLVSDKLLNLEQLALDRVVCTGIGSFCGIPGPQLDEVSSNPCLQLAVLEHMIQWLGRSLLVCRSWQKHTNHTQLPSSTSRRRKSSSKIPPSTKSTRRF